MTTCELKHLTGHFPMPHLENGMASDRQPTAAYMNTMFASSIRTEACSNADLKNKLNRCPIVDL